MPPPTPRVRTEFPREVREVPHLEIPLSDGTRLAARLWLPVDAEADPVPGLLEAVPYRKDDGTAGPDSAKMPYFAGHGYAALRIDLRGSGASEGILEDEYTLQEFADLEEVIAWLAAQPWCTGAVGMLGISWSGFNSLQLAARRPPALKAVITACSTDDVYADDVHYMGGCLLKDDLWWAGLMDLLSATPPDPAVVGDRWRDLWLERLERTPFFAETWLSHQRRDDQWKRGSICEDYAAIECPVLLVGGWSDDYRRSIFRMLEHLTAPRKALIGPWSHMWPNFGEPGPTIGFLQEAVRWWDHWLKGLDNGAMDGPMLRAWMQDPVPEPFDLGTWMSEHPGRWIGEPSWPTDNVRERRLFLCADGQLADVPPTHGQIAHRGHAAAGIEDSPEPERGRDDGRFFTFTSAPFAERTELLGMPALYLDVSADRPVAMVATRLWDVAPDGTSAALATGMLNLTHRDGHEHPEAVVPGTSYRVHVEMLPLGQAIAAGHRLRVGISSTYWRAWPSPEVVTLTVRMNEHSFLALPVRTPRDEDAALAAFGEPERSEPLEITREPAAFPPREIVHDVAARRYELRRRGGGTSQHARSGLTHGPTAIADIETAIEGEPLATTHRVERSTTLARGDWRVRVDIVSVMTSDGGHFHLTTTLDAYEGDVRVFSRYSVFKTPRDLV